MRLTTTLAIVLFAASGAALAQVANTPAEQKLTPNRDASATPGNDMLVTDNSLAGPGGATNQVVDDALENETAMPGNATDAADAAD